MNGRRMNQEQRLKHTGSFRNAVNVKRIINNFLNFDLRQEILL